MNSSTEFVEVEAPRFSDHYTFEMHSLILNISQISHIVDSVITMINGDKYKVDSKCIESLKKCVSCKQADVVDKDISSLSGIVAHQMAEMLDNGFSFSDIALTFGGDAESVKHRLIKYGYYKEVDTK